MEAPTLQSERLVMRPLLSTDGDAFVKELASEPDIMRNLSEHPATPTEQRKLASRYVEEYSRSWHSHDYGGLAVCARVDEIAEPGTFLGYCGFAPGQLEGEGPELSYALGVAHWGRGLATEASRASLDWFFGIAGFERCYVCHHSWNTSSRRIIEKLGFEFSRNEDLWGGVAKGYGLLPTYLLDRESYLEREVASRLGDGADGSANGAQLASREPARRH